MKTRRNRAARPAFTLVELLVVMAVIAILLGVVVPAVMSVAQGSKLSLGGQDLAGLLIAARDQAITRNRKVEIRIIQATDAPGSTAHYRAAQVWIVQNNAGSLAPLDKPTRLPDGVLVAGSTQLSPILQPPPDGSASTGSMTLGGAAVSYRAFTILADGSLENQPANHNSYLTIVKDRDMNATANPPPVDFIAVDYSPTLGRVRIFRP